MSNHQNPVSVRPASQGEVSAAIEESIRQAFLNTGMPSVLVGTTNLAGELNKATVVEVAAPVVETTSEPEMMVPAVDVIVEDITSDGELNELKGFTQDTDGVVWATVANESGDLFMVSENEWAVFYGEAGELEIMGAFDKSFVGNLLRTLTNA